jgi:hypothetical protein
MAPQRNDSEISWASTIGSTITGNWRMQISIKAKPVRTLKILSLEILN